MIGLGWNEVPRNIGFFGLFASKPQDMDCDAFNRNQHFGVLNNAFIRVVDYRRQIELCKFN